ncbi:allantoin permease [Caballeronia pedi]|uniref:Allantoin permease n=1 Tax=Caballeronia pedi TaxID=1777141 RepID=A0A158BSS4_9BURK|nr:hypothetical protein [Caballeronia pedi]SAK73113.1 allantoin permease [Caballeronia pedi]
MANLEKASNSDIDYANAPIPPTQRMGRLALSMAWFALCSAMFWLMVPAVLAQSFGTVNVLIGLALSVVVYGLVNRVIVKYAIRTGLSVSLFSRLVFGKVGAELATLIFFATAIYYAVFEGSVISIAIHSQYPSISLNLAYGIVVAYSVPLVFGSVQKWLDKLNGVLLPFFLVGLVAAVVMSFSHYGYSDAWLHIGPASGDPAGGWWQCFTYFMGVWIMMMYTWDYARFGKEKDAGFHRTVTFGWFFYGFTFMINALVGMFLVGSFSVDGGVNEVSAVVALLKLMGISGLVFVWITQTRINTANFYLSAVNMKSFFGMFFGLDIPKFAWAIVVGVVVYLLMQQNVFSFILQSLAYQGIFVVAWVSIALTHILVNDSTTRPEEIEVALRTAPRFNQKGLVAWFAGTVAGIGVMHMPGFAASFSAPVTALCGALVFAALTKPGRSAQRAGVIRID